ncbi:MAG: hypothetical protein AVO34_13415 [Firmicutes bacterium ML8_F2]|nr:MAG: hypothetical protein AVO34_13415 [Firmicutes bacterium ML8_F2]
MVKLPDLSKALEAGLRAQEDNRDNSVLHVTDLSATLPGEGCPRQLWLKIHGAKKKDLTPGQMLMFWHGKRIHEDLTPLIKAGLPEEWSIAAVELQLKTDAITGTLDVLFHACDNGRIVGDFKSMRGNGFRHLDDNHAKPAHQLQVQTYMYLLDACGYHPPVMGLVFYVDREGQNAFQQRAVPRDDVKVKQAIEEAQDIISQSEPPEILLPEVKTSKATKTKGVPVYIKQPWNCDYCDYCDVSCPGALPANLRDGKVVGHVLKGSFNPAKELPEDIEQQIISELCEAIPF